MRLVRDFRFEAAHSLPNVPEGHKCKRVHGHSYRVAITIDGPLVPELGWVMDFSDIDRVVDPVIGEVDHRLLNDLAGLSNPTSELLAVWLWDRISPALPLMTELSVSETPDSRCVYRGE
jgi:6-pyruvoyltetrahydropterin/6-carboxytetrahydropterin synthase